MIGLILWLIIAGLTAGIANSKGRSPFAGFFIGLCLPILGLIIYALIPGRRLCPQCGQYTVDTAKYCPTCKHKFLPPQF